MVLSGFILFIDIYHILKTDYCAGEICMLPVIVYAAACGCIDLYKYCVVIYETIERLIYAAISTSYERGGKTFLFIEIQKP